MLTLVQPAEMFRDLLVFEIGTLTWSELGAVLDGGSPLPLMNHGLACMGQNLFVYGGTNKAGKNRLELKNGGAVG